MDRATFRIIVTFVGVVLFLAAAVSAFGWVDGNATGLALLAFACWLASKL